jgi:alpha-1,3-mannosyl-glycoprotein beta-1,2-N-acetylglucosaminyltransferase
LQFHPRASVPIVISQDGDNGEVNRVIEEAEKQFKALSTGSSITLEHVHHRADRNIRYENGYFKLADHFKFALNYVFHERSLPAQRVIILEEDLQIAPDFFEYFAATKDLLDNDPTLLAVSAWNDNGFKTLVEDNRVIYRSDFFPGLGWMMTRKLWDELSVKWPRAYWDDWLREPKQRQNRHILRPEVCRTLHFGIHGVSNAQYSEYLESIRLNEEYIKFTEMDLSYLSSEQRWDDFYLDHQVRTAKLMSFGQLRNLLESGTRGSANDHVKVIYGTYDEGSRAPDSYTTYCHFLGCMNNVKAGVPRTAYKGVTTIHKAGYTIHLVPKSFK